MGVREHFQYSGFDLGIFPGSINGFKKWLLFILMKADMKNFIYSNNIMSRSNELIRRLLSGLIDSELENLVRVREEAHPISVKRTPIPKPRRNVQQLIRYFENNPIPPYRPIPAPRTKKQQPIAAPRTKIGEKRRALILRALPNHMRSI